MISGYFGFDHNYEDWGNNTIDNIYHAYQEDVCVEHVPHKPCKNPSTNPTNNTLCHGKDVTNCFCVGLREYLIPSNQLEKYQHKNDCWNNAYSDANHIYE